MSLIQMSVSGAVLVFVILVIRAVAIDKLPKGAFLALWDVALLRFLLPVSIPSPFSVYSLLAQSTPVWEAAETNGTAAPTLSGVGILPVSIWPIIWGTGAALLAALFLVSYLRCRREFRTSLPVENNYIERWHQNHPLFRNIQVRALTGISTPLTYGFFRPVILMPEDTNWEDTRILDFVLFHEYVHIRRWDGLVKLMATAALCVHWFNPLVWVMYGILDQDIELACDAAVVHHFGKADRADYARSLIAMQERGGQIQPLCSHFGKSKVEKRVKSVMKYRKPSVLAIVLTLTITVAVAVGFGTSPTEFLENADPMTANIAQREPEETVEPAAPIREPDYYVIDRYFLISDNGIPSNEVDSKGKPLPVMLDLSFPVEDGCGFFARIPEVENEQ